MSSDSSFPRQPVDHGETPAPEEPSSPGRIIDFPSEEFSSPGMPVPAGTWASVGDGEADASTSTERPLTRLRESGAQVVVFPRQPGTHKRKRPKEREAFAPEAPPSATPLTPEMPRFLASELLKRDWYPRAPMPRTLRWGALSVGIFGMIGAMVLGGLSGLLLATLFAACATAGAFPIPPWARGLTLAVLGVLGTVIAGWMRTVDAHEPAALLIVACLTLTSAALFFRASHRLSRTARMLVAAGLVAIVGWMALTGGVHALVVREIAWQAWAFPLLRVLLALLVIGTAITFLDPTGHGGGWVAGGAFLGWLVLEATATFVLGIWPLRGPSAVDPNTAWLATFALPLMAALAAGGLCQLFVLLPRELKSKREPVSRATIG